VRLKNYINFVLEQFERKKLTLLSDINESSSDTAAPTTLTDYIENVLKAEMLKKINTNAITPMPALSVAKKLNTTSATSIDNDSYFIDSITGRHIALVKKSLLNLIRLAQLHLLDQAASSALPIQSSATAGGGTTATSANNAGSFETNFLNQNLDLISYMKLVSRIETVTNVYNYLDVLPFLKMEAKQKWDMSKPTRLNQDSQREADLKRFREMSSYLIKAKLLDEHGKKLEQKAPIAQLLISSLSSANASSSSSSASNGGYYCRIEMEWKQRSSY
jgi:hypothetical protein